MLEFVDLFCVKETESGIDAAPTAARPAVSPQRLGHSSFAASTPLGVSQTTPSHVYGQPLTSQGK